VCDTPSAGGLSGALVGAEVPVAVALSQGCLPIGPYRTVTAVQRAIVMELDGRPALEALKADAGDILTRDLRRIAGYIHVGLPVEGSDTGAYTVRNLMGLDPRSGAIAVGADLSPGDRLMFVRRDPASARKDFAQRLAELKARIAGKTVRGAHYVSCVARGRNMFGAENGEVAMIHDALGPFPLTGFFANGEICGNQLYGYTGVLTLFLDR
jgi:small ligand-binding sensory domain FIST